MGGNAFDNLRRLERQEFDGYVEEMSNILSEKFNKYAPILFYREKESFGDLDILVQKPKLDRKEFEEWLRGKGVNEFSYNQDFISFKYKDFQTDLIFVPEDSYETAYFYYSYNDLNNLVGRVAHKFGLKFGWDGLSYVIRTESGHEGRKLYLSKSPKEIYSFLGLHYSVWEKGFDNLEQIFKFVSSTPYFHPDMFSYENLNHQNRTRNKKRKTYQLFLEWLEKEKEGLPHYQFSSDKSVYLVKVHNAFKSHDLLGNLTRYANEIELYDQRSKKFNGNLVRAWTGLEGKELGTCIQEFKKFLVYKLAGTVEEVLDSLSSESVEVIFKDWFENK